MEVFTIIIIFAILLAIMAYIGVMQAQNDAKEEKENQEKQEKWERNRKRKKDIDDLTAEMIQQEKRKKVVIPEKVIIPEYVVLTKTKGELTPQEYQILEDQYNQLLYKKGAEPFGTSVKENSRLFIAYDKQTGEPVGQAAILILDTHDFWGAFSKIRNLNLDTQSVILYNVCVVPYHRRRGIAEQLIQNVHNWLIPNNKPNIVLFVDPNNSGAIRLYQRMGYNVDKSHYAPNGAELMMRTKLT